MSALTSCFFKNVSYLILQQEGWIKYIHFIWAKSALCECNEAQYSLTALKRDYFMAECSVCRRVSTVTLDCSEIVGGSNIADTVGIDKEDKV